MRFFIWQVLLGQVNNVDGLVRKTSLVGSFCCLLCQKAEQNLDHLLLGLSICVGCVVLFSTRVWYELCQHRSVCTITEEFLLHPPFRERLFFVAARVCATIGNI